MHVFVKFECTLLWSTKSNNKLLQTAIMTSLMHGRLHINNLPWEWTWKDVRQFVGERGIPKPNFIKQFWGEDTCSSAFLHYYPISMGQLETFAEHLTGRFAVQKPHKRTVCQPALDLFGKRNASARPLRQAIMPSVGSSWQLCDVSSSDFCLCCNLFGSELKDDRCYI